MSGSAAYEPGQTCPECGALVGHWKPCSNASPELQKRWREQDAASTVEWARERHKEQPEAVLYAQSFTDEQKALLTGAGVPWQESDLVPPGAWFMADPASLR